MNELDEVLLDEVDGDVVFRRAAHGDEHAAVDGRRLGLGSAGQLDRAAAEIAHREAGECDRTRQTASAETVQRTRALLQRLRSKQRDS